MLSLKVKGRAAFARGSRGPLTGGAKGESPPLAALESLGGNSWSVSPGSLPALLPHLGPPSLLGEGEGRQGALRGSWPPSLLLHEHPDREFSGARLVYPAGSRVNVAVKIEEA